MVRDVEDLTRITNTEHEKIKLLNLLKHENPFSYSPRL